MLRILHRFIALLLIPALLCDPALAAALAKPLSLIAGERLQGEGPCMFDAQAIPAPGNAYPGKPLTQQAAARVDQEAIRELAPAYAFARGLWTGKLMEELLLGPEHLKQVINTPQWTMRKYVPNEVKALAQRGDVEGLKRLLLTKWGPSTETRRIIPRLKLVLQKHRHLSREMARDKAIDAVNEALQILRDLHAGGLLRKGADAFGAPATQEELVEVFGLFKDRAGLLYDFYTDLFASSAPLGPLSEEVLERFEAAVLDFTERHTMYNMWVLGSTEFPKGTPYLMARDDEDAENSMDEIESELRNIVAENGLLPDWLDSILDYIDKLKEQARSLKWIKPIGENPEESPSSRYIEALTALEYRIQELDTHYSGIEKQTHTHMIMADLRHLNRDFRNDLDLNHMRAHLLRKKVELLKFRNALPDDAFTLAMDQELRGIYDALGSRNLTLKNAQALERRLNQWLARLKAHAEPSGRGYSGLENSFYTPALNAAFRKHRFAAAVFHGAGLEETPVTLDNGTLSPSLTFTELQKDSLEQSLDFISAQDKLTLLESGIVVIFIKNYDQAVRSTAPAGDLLPEEAAGSHYGIRRPQIYLDMNLLKDPRELARHLHHEVEERRRVIEGLIRLKFIQNEKDILSAPRTDAMTYAINELANQAHRALKTEEVVDRFVLGLAGQLKLLRSVLGLSIRQVARAAAPKGVLRPRAIVLWENDRAYPSIVAGAYLHRFYSARIPLEPVHLASRLYGYLLPEADQTAEERTQHINLSSKLSKFASSQLLHSPIRAHDEGDIVQEAWQSVLVVLKRAALKRRAEILLARKAGVPKPPSERSGLYEGGSEIKTWVSRILLNEIYNARRSAGRRQTYEQSRDVALILSGHQTAEAEFPDYLAFTTITEWLFRTNKKFRLTALIWVLNPDLEWEEIRMIVKTVIRKEKISIGTIKSQRARLHADLKKRLNGIIEKTERSSALTKPARPFSPEELGVVDPAPLLRLFEMQSSQELVKITVLNSVPGRQFLKQLKAMAPSIALIIVNLGWWGYLGWRLYSPSDAPADAWDAMSLVQGGFTLSVLGLGVFLSQWTHAVHPFRQMRPFLNEAA